MILATHALTGAVLGKNLENPWLIIFAAWALHYFLDAFRHGEYINGREMEEKMDLKKIVRRVVLDLLAGFALVFLFIFIKAPNDRQIKNILLGVFFSLFPDFLTFIYWKTKIKILKPLYLFHQWLHRKHRPEEREWNWRNAANDIFISILSLIFLFL